MTGRSKLPQVHSRSPRGQLGDDPQPHRIGQRVQHGAELQLLTSRVSDRFGAWIDICLGHTLYEESSYNVLKYGTSYNGPQGRKRNENRSKLRAQPTASGARRLRSAAVVIAQYIQDLTRPAGPGRLRLA